MKNVESWKTAVEKGFEPRAYTYAPDKVPVGEIEAMLDRKIWAKQAMGIGCYFTQARTGAQFVLTVYRSNQDGEYKVRDCPIDFTDCPIGEQYVLKVALNGHGNPFIKEARLKSEGVN